MKRIFPVLIITGLALFLIFYFTANKDTISDLKNINISYFSLAVLMVFGVAFFDALQAVIYARGLRARVSLITGFEAFFITFLFAVMTPFQAGGPPAQIYVFSKSKIQVGKAISLALMKFFSIVFFMMLIVGITFITFWNILPGQALRQFLRMVIVVFIMFAGISFLGIFNNRVLASFLKFIVSILKKVKLKINLAVLLYKWYKNIIIMSQSLKEVFSSNKALFFLGLFISFMVVFTRLTMIFFFFKSLNITGLNYITSLKLSALFIFLLPFMPTPGGSGIGEGVFLLLFLKFIPNHMLGVAVLGVRLLYQYIPAFFGAILTSKYFTELFKKKKIDIGTLK